MNVSTSLLLDNWKNIFRNLNIDDIYALYISDINYNKVLNHSEILTYLCNAYKIQCKDIRSFSDFMREYDNLYPGSRCESKHSIKKCLKLASIQGDYYWISYYLEKDPNLLRKAFEYIAIYAEKNQKELLDLLSPQLDWHFKESIGDKVAEKSKIIHNIDWFIKNAYQIVNLNFIFYSASNNNLEMLLYLLSMRTDDNDIPKVIGFLGEHGSSNFFYQYLYPEFPDLIEFYYYGLIEGNQNDKFFEEMLKLNDEEITQFSKEFLNKSLKYNNNLDVLKWILPYYDPYLNSGYKVILKSILYRNQIPILNFIFDTYINSRFNIYAVTDEELLELLKIAFREENVRATNKILEYISKKLLTNEVVIDILLSNFRDNSQDIPHDREDSNLIAQNLLKYTKITKQNFLDLLNESLEERDLYLLETFIEYGITIDEILDILPEHIEYLNEEYGGMYDISFILSLFTLQQLVKLRNLLTFENAEDYLFKYILDKIKIIPFEYLQNIISYELVTELLEFANDYKYLEDASQIKSILKNIWYHYELQKLKR